MINDIRPVQAPNLILIIFKFPDDIKLGIKVTDDADTSYMECNNIKIWAGTNRMRLYFVIFQKHQSCGTCNWMNYVAKHVEDCIYHADLQMLWAVILKKSWMSFS